MWRFTMSNEYYVSSLHAATVIIETVSAYLSELFFTVYEFIGILYGRCWLVGRKEREKEMETVEVAIQWTRFSGVKWPDMC